MAFKKGFDPCRNLGGRPKKGFTLTDALKKYAEKKDVTVILYDRNGKPFINEKGENEVKKITRQAALVRKVWEMALNGDMAAIHLIWDRTEGRAPLEVINHDGKDIIKQLPREERKEYLARLISEKIAESGQPENKE